jgi:hypothetical protein
MDILIEKFGSILNCSTEESSVNKLLCAAEAKNIAIDFSKYVGKLSYSYIGGGLWTNHDVKSITDDELFNFFLEDYE